MSAASILERCAAAGIPVRADGADLVLGASPDAVPPDLLDDLRANKPALLRILQANDDQSPRWTRAARADVLRWLVFIGETNPDIIAEVLNRCESDPEARRFFLEQSRSVPEPVQRSE